MGPQIETLEKMARSPLTPAALTYAVACAAALAVLPHLGAPLQAFREPHAGAVLLGRDPVQGLLWGLGLGAVLAGTGQTATRFTAWGRRLSRVLSRVLGPLHPADALLLSALSGAAEELVFRGILLPYLGLFASSALFGLAHLAPRDGLWPWSVWAAVAGLGLGWCALATGGVLGPMTAHFTANAVGLLLLSERGR